jgi:hypothetical protein
MQSNFVIQSVVQNQKKRSTIWPRFFFIDIFGLWATLPQGA